MGIKTLLGQVDDESLKKLPTRTRSPERVQQSIDAFVMHLQGVSFRGIQQHFGWKAVSTAENSVRRGEKICKDLNLDSEKIRLKLAAAFDELADITLSQVRQQVQDGRLLTIKTKDGVELRHTAGVDPRLLGEAGRGLMRFAEFVGLTDRAPEQNNTAVTMVQLSAPSDGATFAEKWGGPVVEVDATTQPAAQLAQADAAEPLETQGNSAPVLHIAA